MKIFDKIQINKTNEINPKKFANKIVDILLKKILYKSIIKKLRIKKLNKKFNEIIKNNSKTIKDLSNIEKQFEIKKKKINIYEKEPTPINYNTWNRMEICSKKYPKKKSKIKNIFKKNTSFLKIKKKRNFRNSKTLQNKFSQRKKNKKKQYLQINFDKYHQQLNQKLEDNLIEKLRKKKKDGGISFMKGLLVHKAKKIFWKNLDVKKKKNFKIEKEFQNKKQIESILYKYSYNINGERIKIKKNKILQYNPLMEIAKTNKKFELNNKLESKKSLKKTKSKKILNINPLLKAKYISLPSMDLKERKKNQISEVLNHFYKSTKKLNINKFQTSQSNRSPKNYYYFKKNYNPEKTLLDLRLKDYNLMQKKITIMNLQKSMKNIIYHKNNKSILKNENNKGILKNESQKMNILKINKANTNKFKKKKKMKKKNKFGNSNNKEFIKIFKKSKKSFGKKSLKLKENRNLTQKENFTLTEIDKFNQKFIFKTID